MILFWIQVVIAGLLGAGADVILKQWSIASGLQLKLWMEASVAILIFATLFGLVIRRGIRAGQPLSAIALVVLLVNIGALVLWDSYSSGVTLSPMQWAGFGFGLTAAVCFELG